MHTVSIIPGKTVSISSIAEFTGIPFSDILDQIQYVSTDHYRRFGTQALQIFHDPVAGLAIRNTAVVGMLRTSDLQIELHPKINNLDIGKCLGLAQVSNASTLQISDGKLKDIAMNSDSSSDLIDYFAYSLLDEVIKILHNGLASAKKDTVIDNGKVSGAILIGETIAAGVPINKPFMTDRVSHSDISPNRIIKAALMVCSQSASDEYIQNLSHSLLTSFNSVSDLELHPNTDIDLLLKEYIFTAPRPDYQFGISYARAILEGSSISGKGNHSTPSFTLDLDRVFEGYCSYQIQNMLNPINFDVELQKSISHKMSLNIANKKIIPDVLISNKRTNQSVLLDLKNKYSLLRQDGGITVSNEDLFQLSYYAKTLGIKDCLLVYPSYRPAIQYPIKQSESEQAYSDKCKEKFDLIHDRNSTQLFDDESVRITIYNIDLSGSLRNTQRSIAGLCQFISDKMSYNT